MREERKRPEKYVSTVVIHELYNFTLEREGTRNSEAKSSIAEAGIQGLNLQRYAGFLVNGRVAARDAWRLNY